MSGQSANGRLRVAIDVSGSGSPDTGIGRHTLELVRAMHGTLPDIDLILFHNHFPRSPASSLELGHVVNPRLPSRLLLGLWDRFGWPPVEAFTGPVDIFHTSDWVHPPQRAGATVVPVHDVGPLVRADWYDPEVAAIHARKNRQAAERASAIVAVSAFTRSEFLRLFPIDPARVRVVPAAVSAEFRPQPPAAVAAVLRKWELSGRFLLFVGSRERRKNVEGLVEIFSIVNRSLPDLQLAVVGMRPAVEGQRVHGALHWVGPELEAKVERLGLGTRVRFVGHVPLADLLCIYSAAAALVFPSYYEGFGLPLLEAMACGAPVVGSNRASIPEVVGEAGLLADPDQPAAFAEAVLSLLTDDRFRADVQQRGFAHAATFSWEASARVLGDVYRSLRPRA